MPSERVIHIRKLSQKFAYTSLQMHETIGRKVEISGTDHKYLGFLLQRGQMTAGELSKITGLTTGAVTGLIDRFVEKEFVKREFDKIDRRKVLIVPDTKKIMKLFEPMYRDFQEETENLFASFSPNELKTLEKYFLSAMEMMNNKISNLNLKK